MNGAELLNNLIDELNRARDLIQDNEIDFELVSDIDSDLDRLYGVLDSFNVVLEDIEIE